MASKAAPLVILAVVFTAISTVTAVNVTVILNDYENYSTMNRMFTDLGIAKALKNRNTITVLALNNDNIKALEGLDEATQRRVLQHHVLLDFYGRRKLRAKRTTSMVSLFQSTGEGNGYINATVFKGPTILLKSAVKGSAWTSQLKGEVYKSPYNISVIQVSAPIGNSKIGFEGSPIPEPAPAPKRAPKKKSKKGGNDEEEVEAPSPSEDELFVEEPVEAPVPAPAPEEEPQSPPAPEEEKEEEAAAPSGSSRILVGFGVVVMGLVSTMM